MGCSGIRESLAILDMTQPGTRGAFKGPLEPCRKRTRGIQEKRHSLLPSAYFILIFYMVSRDVTRRLPGTPDSSPGQFVNISSPTSPALESFLVIFPYICSPFPVQIRHFVGSSLRVEGNSGKVFHGIHGMTPVNWVWKMGCST